MKKRWIGLLVRIVISAGLIAYFLSALAKDEGGIAAAVERFVWAFKSTSWQWLFPALMLHLVGFSLTSQVEDSACCTGSEGFLSTTFPFLFHGFLFQYISPFYDRGRCSQGL